MSADSFEEAQGEPQPAPAKKAEAKVHIQAVDGMMVARFRDPTQQLVLSPEGAIRLGKAIARAGREARSQRVRAAQASAPRRG